MSDLLGGEVRLHGYRVHGRVQGVGFRWWTRATAVGLGLTGHVRNLSTGSVEVHVAGRLDLLGHFEVLLAEGPQFARVNSVETIEPDGDMSRATFDVVHW